MIKVVFKGADIAGYRISLSGSKDFGLNISGHAVRNNIAAGLFERINGKKGNNIVCAAVSALSINLLKSIILLTGADVEYQQNSGFFSLSLNLSGIDSAKKIVLETLLSSFYIGISDAADNNPSLIELENIKF